MIVIDTNVLVDAANPESEFHQPCRRGLTKLRSGASPWYLSWGICYEFLRVCTHPRIFTRPWRVVAAWNFLETLLDAPSAGILLPTERHLSILGEVVSEIPHLRGNILHDAQTAALMKEHGIGRIYTRDTDFHRFPFVEVIDPVT